MESKYSECLVYYTLYLDVTEFYFKADHLFKIDGHLFQKDDRLLDLKPWNHPQYRVTRS